MRCRLGIVLAASTLCASASAEVLVIANRSAAIEAIEADDLKDIFLGKRTQIGGIPIEPVVQPESRTHEDFLKTVVGVTPSQYRTYWKKMVFTGQGKFPTSAVDDADEVARVARTPNAIGYIDGAIPHADVVVLKVLR